MPYFFRKLGKMSQNLLSAAVVIAALGLNLHLNLALFILDTGKQALWQTVKTQMKCCIRRNRGRSRISGKGVHMYKGVGLALLFC